MGGDGQDAKLVIDDETLLTGGQGENKSEEQNHHNEVGERHKSVAFFRKNHVAPRVSEKAKS